MALDPFRQSTRRDARKRTLTSIFSEEWKKNLLSFDPDGRRHCFRMIFWVKDRHEENEMKRAGCRSSFLIHHNSHFRKVWDSITCLLLVVLAITLPLTLAFDMSSRVLQGISWVQTAWFLLDVPLNFLTTITSEELGIVVSHYMIAVNYVKTWFFIDLASSMPLDTMVDTGTSGSSIAHGLKLLKLFKLLRILRVDRIIAKIQQKNHIKYSTVAICKFLLILLMGAHWLGLIFWLVSIESGCSQPYCSWVITYASNAHYYSPVDGQCFSETCNEWPLASRYLLCLYWAITTMSTIGFGDITPKNEAEIIYTLFAMLFGTVAFAHGLTNMCSILFHHNKYQVDHEASMDELFDFFGRHSVGTTLGSKIQRYLWYKVSSHQCDPTIKRWSDELSRPLSEGLCAQVISNAFPSKMRASRYLLFNLFGPKSRIYKEMCVKLRAECYLEDDVIVFRGEKIPAIYYIAEGNVEYTDNKSKYTVSKYCSFGEVQSILGLSVYYDRITIRASKDTTLYKIYPEDITKILKKFPALWDEYTKMLRARRRSKRPDFHMALDFCKEFEKFLDRMGELARDGSALQDLFCYDPEDEKNESNAGLRSSNNRDKRKSSTPLGVSKPLETAMTTFREFKRHEAETKASFAKLACIGEEPQQHKPKDTHVHGSTSPTGMASENSEKGSRIFKTKEEYNFVAL
ncbi:hypothetical protein AAMO2058_001341700 [Amorphochlora amoebiformis]